MESENTFAPYIFYKEYPYIENLLNQLSTVAPNPFIAGGCPRDIYLDYTFSDIDIYTTTCNPLHVVNVLGTLPSITNVQIQTAEMIPAHYASVYLLAVVSFVARGIPFQIIITKLKDRESILSTFAVNLSKFYFEGRNLYFTPDALLDVENLTITPNQKFSVNSKYIKKITKKFFDYELVINENPIPF